MMFFHKISKGRKFKENRCSPWRSLRMGPLQVGAQAWMVRKLGACLIGMSGNGEQWRGKVNLRVYYHQDISKICLIEQCDHQTFRKNIFKTETVFWKLAGGRFCMKLALKQCIRKWQKNNLGQK
jgi:hypothetical protein